MSESDTPLRDASTAEIRVEAAEGGDKGVTGAVSLDLPKGWEAEASGGWLARAGWRVAGVLRWRGRTS